MQVLHASRSAWVGIVVQVSCAADLVPNGRRMPEPPQAIQSARAFDGARAVGDDIGRHRRRGVAVDRAVRVDRAGVRRRSLLASVSGL